MFVLNNKILISFVIMCFNITLYIIHNIYEYSGILSLVSDIHVHVLCTCTCAAVRLFKTLDTQTKSYTCTV